MFPIKTMFAASVTFVGNKKNKIPPPDFICSFIDQIIQVFLVVGHCFNLRKIAMVANSGRISISYTHPPKKGLGETESVCGNARL